MSRLGAEIGRTLQPGMHLPEPLELLFSWIEERGLSVERGGGAVGTLFPEERLRAEWTEKERPGGTTILFFATENADLENWFGHRRQAVLSRLCPFALTGADGSLAAFWLDDDGSQKIVHLGSGSGSTDVCVLAEEPVDFLRLLAIGYDELCWFVGATEPPNADPNLGLVVHPNTEFREWVERTFSVDIPRAAAEIVKNPAKLADKDSTDPFCRWVRRNVG